MRSGHVVGGPLALAEWPLALAEWPLALAEWPLALGQRSLGDAVIKSMAG
jgi:hypothetical protein